MTEPRALPSLVEPLVEFSARLHQALGDRHQIASPMGAWMLLAIAATATQGAEREACASALGMDVDAAAAIAARLLRAPHPAVASAAALWTREVFDTPALRSWRSGQPESVVRGEMPSQAEADEWARQATAGLIEKFPGTIEPLTALVLATALAAKSTWTEQYGVIEGKYLGRPRRGGKHKRVPEGTWASRVRLALRSPDESDDSIVRSSLAGDLAVHRMRTASGLSVVSVIAREKVPAGDVLAAALQIATHVASGEFTTLSPYDLPLGHDELWSIEQQAYLHAGRYEAFRSYLPAWEARSEHDLLALPLEIGTAARAIAAMLKAPPLPPQARQTAAARYTRTGFEAAAVSTIKILATWSPAAPKHEGILRLATLRFGHPFAVVAVIDRLADSAPDRGAAPPDDGWRGVPVFSAWVAEPSEAELSDRDLPRIGPWEPDVRRGVRQVSETSTASHDTWWWRLSRFLRRER